MTTRVQPDPLVVQRQNDLFDLWHDFADAHADEPDYDPDDDPEFHAEARQIMGLSDTSRSTVPDEDNDGGDVDPKGDGAVRASRPGQRYRHGWIPIGGSPDAMHEEAQLRAAYEFTDPVTGYRTEVVGIHGPGESNPDLNEWRQHRTVPPGRTMVRIAVLDADGNEIGQACRTIHPASQARVNHNFLVLDEGQRGQGFATRFNAHAEETYRANGIRMITLHANIDVGGYAWARAGYDFRNGTTRSKTTMYAFQESVSRGYSKDIVDEFWQVRRNPDATPLDIAMVGHTPGATTWPGKEIMLDSDWQGVKVL